MTDKPFTWDDLINTGRHLLNELLPPAPAAAPAPAAPPACPQPPTGPTGPTDTARPCWDTWATGFDAGWKAHATESPNPAEKDADPRRLGADRPVAPTSGEMDARPDLSWMLTDEAARLFRNAWEAADGKNLHGERVNRALAALHDELLHRLEPPFDDLIHDATGGTPGRVVT